MTIYNIDVVIFNIVKLIIIHESVSINLITIRESLKWRVYVRDVLVTLVTN